MQQIPLNTYQPISGSRKIGQYLEIKNLDKNKSYSFKKFIEGLEKILRE